MEELVERIIGKENSGQFVFQLDELTNQKDYFELSPDHGEINIKSNSLIGLSSGLNWYLKNLAQINYSWINLDPETLTNLPLPKELIRKESPFKYSYYLNYCTYSYSMAFWDWDRWEKELDWMALNGINLPLAMTGTEAIWKNTLQRMDFSKKEIDAFIPGPAFGAWWLMGNLEGWGGPVSGDYIQQQVDLQNKILTRMKELGMNPVLPGFYGMVPKELKNKFPKADIRDQGLWAGGFDRPAFLSPTDSLFTMMAQIYYEETQNLYGDIEYFSGDPFHEGGSAHGIDLTASGKSIIEAMHYQFPNGKWVFQGWGGNPSEELLSGIENDDVLILDLDCDNRPQWEYREGWHQKPWIWNAVVNFGGNVGMFGRMDVIATEPFRALDHPEYAKNLVGIGAMMEGIENNDVIYELLFDLKWHSENIDLDQWLHHYVISHYGDENENLYQAWQILRKTVYGKTLEKTTSQQGTTESILCARPDINIPRVSTWGSSQFYYQPKELLEAWKLFILEADKMNSNKAFQFDLLDISRQVLADYAQILHGQMIQAYENHNKTEFEIIAKDFLDLLDDQDRLLSSHERYMLGKWIDDARSRGMNPKEKDLFEYNARTQITTWSFQNSNLHEYAHKEWSGLLSSFYKPRWEMFIDYLKQKMEDKDLEEPDYYAFEEAWTKEIKAFPIKAQVKSVEESKRIYQKYYRKIASSSTSQNKSIK